MPDHPSILQGFGPRFGGRGKVFGTPKTLALKVLGRALCQSRALCRSNLGYSRFWPQSLGKTLALKVLGRALCQSRFFVPDKPWFKVLGRVMRGKVLAALRRRLAHFGPLKTLALKVFGPVKVFCAGQTLDTQGFGSRFERHGRVWACQIANLACQIATLPSKAFAPARHDRCQGFCAARRFSSVLGFETFGPHCWGWAHTACMRRIYLGRKGLCPRGCPTRSPPTAGTWARRRRAQPAPAAPGGEVSARTASHSVSPSAKAGRPAAGLGGGLVGAAWSPGGGGPGSACRLR